MSKIYNAIKALAKERGITIQRLEQECALAQGSVAKWNVVSPRVENLSKVAAALNCSVDDILDAATK